MLSIGSSATLSCSTDLNVQSVMWLYDGVVVAESNENTVDLVFNPVTDVINGRQYNCLANSSFGIQQKTITLEASCE